MNDNNEYYSVDLHVHTPASKCYRGEISNAEYINILKQYISKNVKIICITDHNTTKGYDQLMVIKSKYEATIETLLQNSIQDIGMANSLEAIKNEYSIFKSITILPGIEVEVNPNVHILVVLNPTSYNSDEIQKLLCTLGYPEDTQGCETPDIVPSIDMLDFYGIIKNYDCIVVAAHVDSTKGIYNSIQKGKYRAAVFKSPVLRGIQYKNPETAAKIRSIIDGQEEYKRDSQLAYIQASDFHGKDCDFQFSYFKLNDFTYESLRECFNNPIEMISDIKQPQLKDIVKKITENGRYQTVYGNKDEIAKEISMKVCSFLNNPYGYVLVGFQDKPSFEYFGIDCEANQLQQIVEKSINDISSRENQTHKPRFFVQSFGEHRSIGIIFIYTNYNRIYSINGKVYIYINNSFREAGPNDIEELAERNILHLLFEREKRNRRSFESIKKNIDCLIQPARETKILRKMQNLSINIAQAVSVEVAEGKVINYELKRIAVNGVIGQYPFFVENTPSRLPDSYLRVTCPQHNISEYDKDCLFQGNGPAVIFVDGGGCYLVDDETEWNLICNANQCVVLKSESEDLPLEIIIAWMKSTFVLWYTLSEYDETNLYIPEIFTTINIPCFSANERNEIKEIVREIMEYERKYLIEMQDQDDEEVATDLTRDHNKNVAGLCVRIDEIIYDNLNLSNSDREYIEKLVIAKNQFCYSQNNIVSTDADD